MAHTTRGDGSPDRTGRQRRTPFLRGLRRVGRAVRGALGLDPPAAVPTGDPVVLATWQVCGITPPTTRGEVPLSRR